MRPWKSDPKTAIGGRIAPGIPRVPGIGITPLNIRIPGVSDGFMDPGCGQMLNVFDRTGWSFTTKSVFFFLT